MIAFLTIEKQIVNIFAPLMQRYNFDIAINDFDFWLMNRYCKLLFTTERYYPSVISYIIDQNAKEREIYRLRYIIGLRHISFTKPILNPEKDDYNDCRVETLKIHCEILTNGCADLLEGNFNIIQQQGYWKNSEIQEDYMAIKKSSMFLSEEK